MNEPNADAIVMNDYTNRLVRAKARGLCRRHDFRADECTDIEQELYLRVLERAHHFDPRRGSWKTFVSRVVQTGIASLVRERRRQMRAAGFQAVSIDEQAPGAFSLLPRDLLTERDAARHMATVVNDERDQHIQAEAVRHVLATLEPLLQAICALLIDGTVASAARTLGIPRSRVEKYVKTIREQFRAAGLEETRSCPKRRSRRRK